MTTRRKMVKNYDESTLTLYGATYAVSSLSKTIQSHCTLHGLCQKLIDSTAGMNNDSYTDKERSDRVAQVWNQLKADQWTKPGEGKATMKKKVDEAKSKATPEELAVLKKLGLV